MTNVTCPVPDCTKIYRRQTFVNDHLRDDHGIVLENGKGGNMTALRKRQQQQFSQWLEANGHSDASLFADDIREIGADNENNTVTPPQPQSQAEEDGNAISKVSKRKDLTERKRQRKQRVRKSSGSDELLQMMETTDQSGLDVSPQHANDIHKIVREDGALLNNISRSVQ